MECVRAVELALALAAGDGPTLCPLWWRAACCEYIVSWCSQPSVPVCCFVGRGWLVLGLAGCGCVCAGRAWRVAWGEGGPAPFFYTFHYTAGDGKKSAIGA